MRYALPKGALLLSGYSNRPAPRSRMPHNSNASTRVSAQYVRTLRSMPLEPDDLESQVVAVWQDVLGLSSLPGDMTFFEAGGTSLLAARLACRLETALQRRVSPADLFVCPTPRDLARSLHNAEAPGSDTRHARPCSSETLSPNPLATDAQDRAAQQREAFASFRPRRLEMRRA
jgi:hypothetical protein